jgi:hypothetical protein
LRPYPRTKGAQRPGFRSQRGQTGGDLRAVAKMAGLGLCAAIWFTTLGGLPALAAHSAPVCKPGREWRIEDSPGTWDRIWIVETFEGYKLLQRFIPDTPQGKPGRFTLGDATLDRSTCVVSYSGLSSGFGKTPDQHQTVSTHIDGQKMLSSHGGTVLRQMVTSGERAGAQSFEEPEVFSSLTLKDGELRGVELLIFSTGWYPRYQAVIQIANGESAGVYVGAVEYDGSTEVQKTQMDPSGSSLLRKTISVRFTKGSAEVKLTGTVLSDAINMERIGGGGRMDLEKRPSFWDAHDWEEFRRDGKHNR